MTGVQTCALPISTHSSTRGLRPPEQLERPAGFPSSDKTRPDSQKRVKKIGLKLNIQKTKMMTSGPITAWQIDGETMEAVTDLIFLGSKITADGDCTHEIK